jgi:FixJ family two-component response regulator
VDLLGRYSKEVELDVLLRSLGQVTPGPSQSLPEATPTPRIHALERRLRREDFDQILVDYLAGKTSRQLAREYNLSKTSVLRILHRSGVVRRRGDTTSVVDE